MNVPECVLKCVQNANDMACVSVRVEMKHGPTQTGDVGRVTDRAILETVPAPWDAACEVRSISCERPKRARLHDREPVLKHPVIGTKSARCCGM